MTKRDEWRALEGTDLEETERLLFVTRDEPEPLTLAGFARRTSERASVAPRRSRSWAWRWALGAAGITAGAALWWQVSMDTANAPARAAAVAPDRQAMHEETVDYEFALDALDEADLASFDRWLEQDPS